ncbi:hypothetical protein [Polyangium mundeleinium]|uniref:Uncharacterized protein n=1 Tax=Polyangium mundeleinium TaxID=2995306 RepID=A0ABT5EU37_9BACT|nr:hypothetical protein [Polyangium mundeleinium]MDC0744869.1 hypothetical protein [Polyangium mundeleinium]
MSQMLREADIRAAFERVRERIAAGRDPGRALRRVTRSDAEIDLGALSATAGEQVAALFQFDGILLCAAGEAKGAIPHFDAALTCTTSAERRAGILYHRGLALLLSTLRGPPAIHPGHEVDVQMARSPVVRLFSSAGDDVAGIGALDALLDAAVLPAEPLNGRSVSKARLRASRDFDQSHALAPANRLAAFHGALCHLMLGALATDLPVRARLASLTTATTRTDDTKIRELAQRCAEELADASWWVRHFGRVDLPTASARALKELDVRPHEPPSLEASHRSMIVVIPAQGTS